MKAQAQNVLESQKFISRDRGDLDKASIKGKKMKKEGEFKEKIRSFSEENKNQDKYNLKNQAKEDKSKKKKSIEEKNRSINANESERTDKSEVKDEDLNFDSDLQAYLLSLFDASSKSNQKVNFHKVSREKNSIETGLIVEDMDLSLPEELKNISLESEFKGLNSETTNSNIEGKKPLEIEVEVNKDLKTNESKTKTLNLQIDKDGKTQKPSEHLNLEGGENAIQEDSKEFNQLKNMNFNELSRDEEYTGNDKKVSKEIEIEFEDFELNQKEIDSKDESFGLNKKIEVDLFKNIDKLQSKSEPIDTKKTIKQIADQMKFSINNNKNQIKVNLKPKTLGELTMEIEVVKSSLNAKIMVDNQKTKELIQNNLFQLKEEIKDTGLEIKSFEVFVGNGDDFSKQGRGQFNFNKKNQNKVLKTKKISQKDGDLAYNDSSIDIDKGSDVYLEGRLNLLA